jgi:hypothetical protein
MTREYVPNRKPSRNLAGRQRSADLRAGAIAYPAKQLLSLAQIFLERDLGATLKSINSR